MPGGFQSQVNVQPSPAVAGDFASSNPRALLDAGPGGLVSGSAGVTVGVFAWTAPPLDPNSANMLANNFPVGQSSPFGATSTLQPPSGFVHREQQGLITKYLADASMVIPQGFPVSLAIQGDFWCVNAGSTQALVGMKAYARLIDGAVIFSTASGSPATATVTGSIQAVSSAFAGAISGNVLSVTGTPSTALVTGALLGTAGSPASNTVILGQLTGVTGSAGTYLVSVPEQAVTASSMTANWGVFNGTTVTGTIGVGDTFTTNGTLTTAGVMITALGTGLGGTGTYIVNLATAACASTTTTVTNAVETKWYAASAGTTGELVKITSWVGSQG